MNKTKEHPGTLKKGKWHIPPKLNYHAQNISLKNNQVWARPKLCDFSLITLTPDKVETAQFYSFLNTHNYFIKKKNKINKGAWGRIWTGDPWSGKQWWRPLLPCHSPMPKSILGYKVDKAQAQTSLPHSHMVLVTLVVFLIWSNSLWSLIIFIGSIEIC